MKKQIEKMIMTAGVLVWAGAILGCGQVVVTDQEEEQRKTEADGMQDSRENSAVQAQADGESGQAAEEDESIVQYDTADSNETLFFEKAQKQGVACKEAESCWERLLADDVFLDGAMELTGLMIEDMDGNGQKDMLVMVLDHVERPFYGSGCVWIYMNEDAPYCFADEDCSYYGCFDSFAEDIDNDGNVEIVLSAQGTGCGAVGDSYKVIFKYRENDHTGQNGEIGNDGVIGVEDEESGKRGEGMIERMELPSDLLEEYDRGLMVIVDQEPEKNRYSAYCPYMKEKISFGAENVSEPADASQEVGGNARGFFHLTPVKYEGKNALQASEYLYGEGGVVHGIATAQFIIQWDEKGVAYVAEWWIEEDRNNYVNYEGSRIAYADGYYYYASQLDHYYLYRAKEDGSEAACHV